MIGYITPTSRADYKTTHPTVKSRAYELINQWTEEFKKDPSLSIMDETLRQLKAASTFSPTEYTD